MALSIPSDYINEQSNDAIEYATDVMLIEHTDVVDIVDEEISTLIEEVTFNDYIENKKGDEI